MRRKVLLITGLALAMVLGGAVSAFATDFNLDGIPKTEYYPETSYESVYGSRYNYGGINAVDYELPDLPYGMTRKSQTGCMEKSAYPTAKPMSFDDPLLTIMGNTYAGYHLPQGLMRFTAFTSASFMKQSDGTMGTISIPALGVSFKVRDGETTANMNKGFAHYSSTSGWDGNVGVCAHNRGCKYAIGAIKDIQLGSEITYKTLFGTRTYLVESVNIIANNDWSYLQPTSDNRLTITTCLADHPDVRVCVQAVGIN